MKHFAMRAPWAPLFMLAAALPQASAQEIPSPLQFFGHEMGADRKLARWDKLVEYYELIGEVSDRVDVRNVGESTLGNPFLIIFVSSPENLANLDRIKAMNAILQDPRGATDAQIEGAIANGKSVVVQSYGLHSTEVAASQSSAEIIYLMATRNDPEMMRILEETVAIQIPCFNPDGNIIVTDWYDRWVGTEYEASSPPELYHHYIGHDNNRDAFMQNTVESRYGAEILFREWVPQAYIDHHQMGGYTARMYVPPYAEPIRPGGDPLVWREMSWYGAQIAYGLEEAGRAGIVNAAVYSGWGHFGFHWITPFHNIAGMLTESASARLATPVFIHPEELGGSRQQGIGERISKPDIGDFGGHAELDAQHIREKLVTQRGLHKLAATPAAERRFVSGARFLFLAQVLVLDGTGAAVSADEKSLALAALAQDHQVAGRSLP